MKHFLLCALLILGMIPCNARKNTKTNKTKAKVTRVQPAAKNASTAVALELTNKGVGPIVLGMKVSKIPASVAGLYDRVNKVTTPSGEEYHFYSGETALFSAEDPDEGIITCICLVSESPIVDKTTKKKGYISR